MEPTKTKTGDMTLAQIIQGVEAREQGFFAKMNAVLGGDVVETIIKEQQNLNATRGVSVGLSVIQAAIRQAARIKSAEQIDALAIGQRDTVQLSAKGKRLPGKVTFLRTGPQGNFEIAVWGKSLKNGAGAPADIVLPSIVRISVEKTKYTTKNNDIGESINLLDVIKTRPLEGVELATKLIGAFKTKKFGDITELDQYQIVIVKGKVSGVNPIPLFTKTSDGDEVNKATWEKSGELPIMMADESPDKLMHPVLQIALAIEDGTAIRVSLDQRRFMHGVYMMEDFAEIVAEAYEAFPDDAEKQAASVSGFLLGRPIMAVGSVTGVRGDKATGIRNVDISASAVIDVPENMPILASDPGQMTLPTGDAVPAPAAKPLPTSEPKKSSPKKAPAASAAPVKSQSEIISAIRDEFPNICGVMGLKNITDRPLADIIATTKLNEKYDPLLIEVAYESKRPKEEAVQEEVPSDADGTKDEGFEL